VRNKVIIIIMFIFPLNICVFVQQRKIYFRQSHGNQIGWWKRLSLFFISSYFLLLCYFWDSQYLVKHWHFKDFSWVKVKDSRLNFIRVLRLQVRSNQGHGKDKFSAFIWTTTPDKRQSGHILKQVIFKPPLGLLCCFPN